MIRTLSQKLRHLAGNPVDLFVITYRKDDGTVEYTATLSNPEGICQVTCMYDNWFEATWYGFTTINKIFHKFYQKLSKFTSTLI